MPASARIWGGWPGSRSRPAATPRVHSCPKRSRYQRWPCTIWRTSDSPEGTLQSASTHMPPTGWNWPAATRSRMRSNRAGYRSSTQARWRAAEHTNSNSGYSSMSVTALAKLRAHLRAASRMGHSQAVSMWAWPTALMRWAPSAGRVWRSRALARASRPAVGGAGHVVRVDDGEHGGERLEEDEIRPAGVVRVGRLGQLRARCAGRRPGRRRSAGGRPGRSGSNRKRGAPPGSASSRGQSTPASWAGTAGLAAASTYRSTVSSASARRRRTASRRSHESPTRGAPSRQSRPSAGAVISKRRATSSPAQAAGTRPVEAEPRRAPRRSPPAADVERGERPGHRFLVRHGLAGQVAGAHLERSPFAEHRRLDDLDQQLPGPGQDRHAPT